MAHLSCWFWNKRRVPETMEEMLPPRFVLVLQAAALSGLSKVAGFACSNHGSARSGANGAQSGGAGDGCGGKVKTRQR